MGIACWICSSIVFTNCRAESRDALVLSGSAQRNNLAPKSYAEDLPTPLGH
jgi:hypothetical protein